MNLLEEYCIQRNSLLEKIIQMARQDIRQAPPGTVHQIRKGKGFQYYWKKEGPRNTRSYIRKSDRQLASHLAQKEYANKIISMAETDLEVMKKMSKIHKAEDYIGIYNTIADGKRLLVKPYILSDEEYITSWLEGKRKGDQSYIDVEEEDAIVTEKGEFVRSKSEKILADKLFSMGIPYRYEEPLYLNDYKRVLPDFTVLNIRTREEMYWEHLGMMDESDYCENAIRKIESYEKNNIFPGKKLILTYETLKHPLNSGVVDALIKEYLL